MDIEGLILIEEKKKLESAVEKITADLLEEGFIRSEITEYLFELTKKIVFTKNYEIVLDVYGPPSKTADDVPTIGSIKIERVNPGSLESYPEFKLTGKKQDLIQWLVEHYDEDENFFNKYAKEI